MRKLGRVLQAVLVAGLLTTVNPAVVAQESSGVFKCKRFVQEWSNSQQIIYVQGLLHGYATATAYAEGVWNDQTNRLIEKYRTYAVDTLVTESFLIGVNALKESIRDRIEPALKRPGSELRRRLVILCERNENTDRYVSELMTEALENMGT